MLSPRRSGLACAVTVFVCLMAAPVSAQPLDKRTIFTFSGPVTLPGVTLPAGKYLFRLADPMSSAKVVQVLNADGTEPYGLFFTLPVDRPEPASSPEVQFMETAADTPAAIRTWWYPGERRGYEFIFPKEQARRLAKGASQPVLTTGAQTTTTEQTNTAALSRVDAGGQESEVTASSTTAPATSTGNTQQGQLASSSLSIPTPLVPAIDSALSTGSTAAARSRDAGEAQPIGTSGQTNVARSGRTELPQTGSELPLFGTVGTMALLGAASLRFWRTGRHYAHFLGRASRNRGDARPRGYVMSRVGILIAMLAGMAVAGGQGSMLQVTDVQAPTFSSRAELVVAHVTVKNGEGAYVTALPQEAFKVFEDGVPQRINFFIGEDSPVTVGLLIDSSGSMRAGRARVIAAAAAFAQSGNSEDQLFALAFNERVRAALPPSMPFTSDAEVFRAALDRAMGARGRTAMYDAISDGLSYIAQGHYPRRVLAVVGDGGDNASTTTFEEVLKEAQASNAAIYTVGIIDPLERDANPRSLKRLAQATGGESFFPRDVSDVGDALQRIAEDIRHSYTLGYVSTNPERDSRFRRIRVVVTDPAGRSLRVRTRDGYRAGGPPQGEAR